LLVTTRIAFFYGVTPCR